MYGSYGKKRYPSKKGYKNNKPKRSGYSKSGKRHGTKTVITKYRW